MTVLSGYSRFAKQSFEERRSQAGAWERDNENESNLYGWEGDPNHWRVEAGNIVDEIELSTKGSAN